MYSEAGKKQLLEMRESIADQYKKIKGFGLSLNMSRGVPSIDQIEIVKPMLDVINSDSSLVSDSNINCGLYGTMDGLPEAKKLFGDMMDVESDMVFVGGNSSLNMMFDAVGNMMYKSPYDDMPSWSQVEDRKFLCPVPGYDRHFAVTEYFGFQMINVPMRDDGPDMDIVDELVKDPAVKGIWCIPKYSNPTGVTYSDEVVRRFASLKPAAKDFRIFWDNAYAIHELTDEPDVLLSLWDECKKTGNVDLPLFFCSTSKVTFSGAGVAAMAGSDLNMKFFKSRYTLQTIGFDKINMLRHVRFFKNIDNMKDFMNLHKEHLKKRFDIVCDKLDKELVPLDLVKYKRPKGGYFVSVELLDGTAKRVVQLCKEAGVTLTGAGATYPYKNDPDDSNIRIAPSFPSTDDLAKAIDVFCYCVKIAAIETFSQ